MSTAGPAWSAAALPVRTKMPAPMMQPMPRNTRFHGPSERLSSLVRVSSWILATLLRSPIRPRKLLFGAAVAIRSPLECPVSWRRSLAAQTARAIPLRCAAYRASIGPSGCAAEDVDMEMRRLPGPRACRCWPAGDSPGRRPRHPRDLADGADEVGDFRVRAPCREIVPADT